MTIIAAAIKNGKVSISCDSQSNNGSLIIHAKYKKYYNKLIEINGSVIGVSGWTATTQILEHLITTKPKKFKLNTRWEIFEMLLSLHGKLKDKYYIETREDSEQPVESNQLDGLIVNSNGIFEFDSYREVDQFTKFWAIGSGRDFALGAMHALYDNCKTAQEISEAGVKAASEFDDGCDLPMQTIILDMNNKNLPD